MVIETTIARKKCTCKHPYQDRRYGKQVRIHNKTVNGRWRCTVCAQEKD